VIGIFIENRHDKGAGKVCVRVVIRVRGLKGYRVGEGGQDSGKRDERKREGGVEESKQRAVTKFGKGRQFGYTTTWLSRG